MAVTRKAVKQYVQGRMIKNLVITDNKLTFTMLDDRKVVAKFTDNGIKLFVRDRSGDLMKQHEVERFNDGLSILMKKMRMLFPTGEFDNKGTIISDSIYTKKNKEEYARKHEPTTKPIKQKKRKQKLVE